jgi:hypothetical protein
MADIRRIRAEASQHSRGILINGMVFAHIQGSFNPVFLVEIPQG